MVARHDAGDGHADRGQSRWWNPGHLNNLMHQPHESSHDLWLRLVGEQAARPLTIGPWLAMQVRDEQVQHIGANIYAGHVGSLRV